MKIENIFSLKCPEKKLDGLFANPASTKLGQNRKLKKKKMWKSPYLVVKVISPVLYQIIKGTKEPRIGHHDRLKLCLDRDVPVRVKRQRKLLFEDIGDTEQGNNVLEIKTLLAQSALHSITPARIASLGNLTYCCHARCRSQYPLKLGTHISPGWREAQTRLTSCPKMLSHINSWHHWGSNPRPLDYKSNTLPTEPHE